MTYFLDIASLRPCPFSLTYVHLSMLPIAASDDPDSIESSETSTLSKDQPTACLGLSEHVFDLDSLNRTA